MIFVHKNRRSVRDRLLTGGCMVHCCQKGCERMLIGICTQTEDVFRDGLDLFAARYQYNLNCEYFTWREDLLYRMKGQQFDVIFVGLKGAIGMETVIGVRDMDTQVPLVWISSEKEFISQSYRLNTTMFLVWPVEPEQVCDAMLRCMERHIHEYS